MEKYTFWEYFKDLLQIKKFTFGTALLLISFLADFIQIIGILPIKLSNLVFILKSILFPLSILMLMFGLYQYAQFLFKTFSKFKQKYPLGLAFSDEAEYVFKIFRKEILH